MAETGGVMGAAVLLIMAVLVVLRILWEAWTVGP